MRGLALHAQCRRMDKVERVGQSMNSPLFTLIIKKEATKRREEEGKMIIERMKMRDMQEPC